MKVFLATLFLLIMSASSAQAASELLFNEMFATYKAKIAMSGLQTSNINLNNINELNQDIIKLDVLLDEDRPLDIQMDKTEEILNKVRKIIFNTKEAEASSLFVEYRETLVKYLELRLQVLEDAEESKNVWRDLADLNMLVVQKIKKSRSSSQGTALDATIQGFNTLSNAFTKYLAGVSTALQGFTNCEELFTHPKLARPAAQQVEIK